MTGTVVQEGKKVVTNLPSDTKQAGIVARYDILKYLYSKRLIGIIAIEALVLVLITVLPPLLGKSYTTDPNQFIGNYANFTSIIVVIGATLFSGDAIVSEYQGRTGYLLFPNPVKKSSLLAGKFIASMAAMFLALLIYYVVALSLDVAITGAFSTLGVESLLLAMLYSVALLSVGYLISSVMKGSTGSLMLTFSTMFLIFPIASAVLSSGGVDPWFILQGFVNDTISYITQVPYPSNGMNGAGLKLITTGVTFVPDVGVSIAVMAAYAVVALLLSYFVFKRREMSA